MKETKKKYTHNRFLEKIVVNAGIGKLKNQANFEEKVLPEIMKEIASITGQKPATRKAKKSIAGFNSREGDVIGLQVTLRRSRMDDFIKKLVTVIFPRVKDFRGLDMKNIDTHGNLNVGFHDQYVFPEINLDKLTRLLEEEYEFLPLPKYPAVMRDLSLEMREAAQVGDILNAIETAPAKDVRDVDLIDYYDSKRFTFRLVFQSDKRTLTDQEVNRELDSIIKVLKRKFRLQVR